MRRIAAGAANYAGRFAGSTKEATMPLYGICKFNEGTRSIKTHAATGKSRGSTVVVKKSHTAPRRLTSNKPKTAGRNSAGRITAYHRGGGSKRLYRKIDLQRNTPSIGVVERIEYDPNRSSNIALVRWSEGMHPHLKRKPKTEELRTPPSEILAPMEVNTRGRFSFASMRKETNQGNVSCFSTQPKVTSVVVGLPTEMTALSKDSSTSGSKCSLNDVFLSVFSRKAMGWPLSSCSSSVSLPRVAVAGAKPAFYGAVTRENGGIKSTFSLSEIKKWNSSSTVWAHRLKRKAAVSWHCSRSLPTGGLLALANLSEQKS